MRRPSVPPAAVRAVRAVRAMPLLLALVGCSAALTRFPEPHARTRREAVEQLGTSCRADRCTHVVGVGGRRLRVEARTRERSPDELRGRTVATVARGAASAVAGAVMRRNGFTTHRTTVGLGARVVEDRAGTLRLRCDVAWIDAEAHERVSGEDRSTTHRLAEGWACDVADRGDTTAVRWTLRAGIAPQVDSVAAVLEMLDRGDVGTIALDRPLRLARIAADGTASAAYDVVRTEGDAARRGFIDVHAEQWTVRRADGTLVGVVHVAALPRIALDLADAATSDEVELLRLLAATIAQPLR